jgi:type IV pilus assembly protein PilV
MKSTSRYSQGSSLLEGILAILIFSVGLISILMLLTTTLTEVGNARYRSEASLLASSLIAEMWVGDRSLVSLSNRYGSDDAQEYKNWRDLVISKLPGITATTNKPVITIDSARNVNINIYWQVPGDPQQHKLIAKTVITD